MNLRELEYLVAVGDHGHFGRAAQACHVSQPTLSTQLRKLEDELGVRLVERTPRRATLTPVGRLVVERARQAIHEVDDIAELARAARDPSSGTLRVGLFPTLAPYLLPHVVAELHQRFPRLELLLVEEKSATLLARLRDGELDAALLARPQRDETLHEEPLFAEEFLLALPLGHPLARDAEPVDVAVLAHQDLLLLDEGHCLRDQALSVCASAGARERRGFRATSLETLRQMVAAGVGITLLPRLAVEPPVTPSAGIVLRTFRAPAPEREIAMYWRRTSPLDALLREVSEVVRAGVPSLTRLDPHTTSR